MAVIGQVEAVLTARDGMSPALISAANNVKELSLELITLGKTAGTEFNRLNGLLAEAENRFKLLAGTANTAGGPLTEYQDKIDKIRLSHNNWENSAGGAAASTKRLGEEATHAAGGVNGLELMVTRLVERFAILMALRFGAEFIVDLYRSADALVRMNETTDMSINKLQAIKYASEQTGVEFEKVSTAIAAFDKNLAQDKMTTEDALQSIGLNFDKIFAMSPDERFDAVVAAIAKLPNQLQRTAAEVALFGTDAIDPMVKKLHDLELQAPLLEESTIRGLSGVVRSYKGFWGEVEPILDKWIEKGIHATSLLAGEVPGAKGYTPSQRAWILAMSAMAPGMISQEAVQRAMMGSVGGDSNDAPGNVPSGFVGPLQQGPTAGGGQQGPLRNQEFINSLIAESQALRPLTEQQKEWLVILDRLNKLSADNAARIGLNSVQFAEYQRQLVETKKVQAEYEAGLKKFREAMDEAALSGDGWKGTLDGIDGSFVEGAKALHEAGMGWDRIATIYGLMPNQVRAIELSIADAAKTAREAAKEHAALAKELEKIEVTGAKFQLDPTHLPGFINNKEFQATAKAYTEIIKLEDDLTEAITKDEDTSLRAKLAHLDSWVIETKLKYAEAGDIAKTQLYDVIDRLAAQNAKNLIHANDPVWIAWKKLNEDMGKEWANTWSAALESQHGFVNALASPFLQIQKMWLDLLGSMVAAWENKLIARLTGVQLSAGLGASGGIPGSGGVGGVGGLDIGSIISSGRIQNQGPNAPEFGATGGMGSTSSSGSLMAPALIGVATGLSAGLSNQPLDQKLEQIGISAVGVGMLAGSAAAGIATAGISLGIVGGIMLIKKLFGDHTQDDVAYDAGLRFGQEWSKGLQETVTKNAKEFTDPESGYKYHDIMAGELYSLPDIMKENPVTGKNIDMYLSKTHDLFSMIDLGHMTVGIVGKELDLIFPQMLESATDTYGFISDKLQEIIHLNDVYGTQSKAIMEWRKALGASQIGNFGDVIGASSGGPARNASELGDLGQMAIGAFATARATGMSQADALKSESAALTELEKEYKDLGVTVEDEALKELFALNNMYKATGPLITGLDGLRKTMVANQNLLIETPELFETQERVGYNMYVRLQAAAAAQGKGSKEALEPMQEWLHAAAEEAKKLKVPLDENTQRLIDQSKELGIWHDKAEDAADTTSDLAAAIHELVNWLKGIPPNVHSQVDVDVTTNHHDTGSTPGFCDDPAAANFGGPGVCIYDNSGGGRELNNFNSGNSLTDNKSSGSNGRIVRPLLVQPYDTGNTHIGSSSPEVSRLASIGVSTGGINSNDSYQVNVTLVTAAKNGRELLEEAKEPGGLFDQLANELAMNKRSRLTLMKRGLESI